MSENSQQSLPQILSIQNSIIDGLLGILSVAAAFIVPLSLSRIYETGFHPVMLIHTVISIMTWLIFFFKNKLKARYKISFIVTVFTLVGIGAAFKNQNSYAALAIFIITINFSSIYFSQREVIIFAFPLAMFTGWFTYHLEGVILHSIMITTASVMFSLISIYGINKFRQALQVQDWATIRSHAHQLKGNAATLYAESFKKQAMLIMQRVDDNAFDQLADELDKAEAIFAELQVALEKKLS